MLARHQNRRGTRIWRRGTAPSGPLGYGPAYW